jgi:hypothetical protein
MNAINKLKNFKADFTSVACLPNVGKSTLKEKTPPISPTDGWGKIKICASAFAACGMKNGWLISANQRHSA